MSPKTWINEIKVDARPQRYGWAPGGYICRCLDCKEEFIGDKRAITCADCAYAKPNPQPRVPQFMWGDLYGEFSS